MGRDAAGLGSDRFLYGRRRYFFGFFGTECARV